MDENSAYQLGDALLATRPRSCTEMVGELDTISTIPLGKLQQRSIRDHAFPGANDVRNSYSTVSTTMGGSISQDSYGSKARRKSAICDLGKAGRNRHGHQRVCGHAWNGFVCYACVDRPLEPPLYFMAVEHYSRLELSCFMANILLVT